MRKLVILFVAGCLLSIAAAASATPYSNTVTFTSADHNVLTGTGTFTWQHEVTSDFQIPFDIVNSAKLTITSQRAIGENDLVTVINFGELSVLGADGNSQYKTIFDLEDYGVFSATWGSGQPLKLSLTYDATGNPSSRSLTMVQSEFKLDYTNATAPEPPTAPVPEPGTMVLFGCGILGVAVFSKRRNNRVQ